MVWKKVKDTERIEMEGLMEEKKQKPKERVSRREAAKVFNLEQQTETFNELQPLFYDKAGLWWLWNNDDSFWEVVDDVDILNMIHEATGTNIINSKARTEILNSLKQKGRLNIPKPIEKTWIQFKDKIVDILTGKEFIASPAYFVTNPIPWGLGDSEETPEMDKLFKEWVFDPPKQDESYVKTLHEALAYSCSTEQFLQMIVALTGSGSNGKGTFLQVLTKFIGEKNTCSSELKTLAMRNFETSALYKKLLCQIGEVDIYDIKNTNLLKKLTGEDLIRYEFKGKTAFSEYSPTTCIIATNSLPITPDKSIGFYRRWLIIDFPHQFKVKRNVLSRIPDVEFNNLARKVVSILKELYKRGEFTNAGSIEERTSRYEDRSNPVERFIEGFCEDMPDEKIKLQEFTTKLNKVLKNRHLRPMNIRQVSSILREELGYEVGSRRIEENGVGTSARVILNLKFKDKTIRTTRTTEVLTQHIRIGINKNDSSSSSSGSKRIK